MRLKLRDFLALSTAAYLLSVLSKILYPGFYTDIIALYYRAVLPTSNGIPYHSYFLEYPAIPAILIWVSGLAPSAFYYMVTMAFLMFFFVIAAVYFLYRICTDFGMDRGRIIPFFIMAPSFLVMSFYNWDIVAIGFTTAALYYFLRGRANLSGFLLGLGFAVKIYPLFLLPVFVKEVRSWNGRVEMFLSAILGGIIPNLPFIIVDFRAVYQSYTSHIGPYVEGSLWLIIQYYRIPTALVTQDWLDNAVVWSLIILAILHVTFSRYPLVRKLWLVLAAFLLVYFTYPPQFSLWLLPLFVLDPAFSIAPFLAFDFLDSAIILSWFTVNNPWAPWGPIWIISFSRIAILAAMLVWVTRTSSRHSGEQIQVSMLASSHSLL
jgi:uncharacterized membrane protein